jgi:hypothetical protein
MTENTKVKIKILNNDEAMKFYNNSHQSSIFTNPKFLSFFDYEFIWYLASYGNEPYCLWPVSKNKGKVIIPEFFYYFGPVWLKDEIKNHKWLKISNEIYTSIITNIINDHGNVENQMHYSLNDIRSFDWWNYHSGKRFEILPRYSAIINNILSKNLDELQDNFRYCRRYEIKNFQKKFDIKIENNLSEKVIIDMYKKIFSKKNINVSKNTENSIISLYKAVKNNLGNIIVIKNSNNDDVISAALLLNDKYSSNLVLNLNNEDYIRHGSNAYLIYEILKHLKRLKINILDFNGANSPNRSDDKHSYGSYYKLYFQIRY